MYIQTNHYVLPAIQREFVWGIDQIQKLFDSLMRGYPIGSFLLWKIEPEHLQDYQFYRFLDRYHERDHRHNEKIPLMKGERPVVAVLDGQQRLTALNLGLRGWYAEKLPYYRHSSDWAYPKRKLYLNLLAPPNEDGEYAYQFKLLREGDEAKRDDEHYWFKVGDILQLNGIQDIFSYCVDNDLLSKELRHPSETLSQLWKVLTQQEIMSAFMEEDQNLDKVLNIFIRVNSGGTQLSYSDILLSVATAQWVERDAREEMYSLIDNLNQIGEGFHFSKDFVLKACLVLADIQAIEFKVNNFVRENMLRIEQMWDRIVMALTTTTRLVASWGYNRDTLVAYNAIIPLAYYIMKTERNRDFISAPAYEKDRAEMQIWLRRAFLIRLFSGQPDNVLRRVRTAIQGNVEHGFPAQRIYDALRGTTKSMVFDEDFVDALLDYQYGSSYTFTILAYYYPWLKFDNHFHMDHIFPKSMFTQKRLEKAGVPRERRQEWIDHKNDLANLQLLQGLVNQNKSDKEFETWLKEGRPTDMDMDAYRKEHLIPDVDLSIQRFPEFLEARNALLKKRLMEGLGVRGE